MRIFCGIMSIQAGFIGALAEILSPDSKKNNLFMIPEDLAASSGYLMSLAMVLAGILIICAYRNDFLIFMALILWLFGLIFGLIFTPSYSGFYFRPIVCLISFLMAYLFLQITQGTKTQARKGERNAHLFLFTFVPTAKSQTANQDPPAHKPKYSQN